MSIEMERLRKEYDARITRGQNKGVYSLSNPSYLFTIQQREREVLKMLERNGFGDLRGKRILEVGCGTGGVLRDYVRYGAQPELITGIDYLEDRVKEAYHKTPNAQWACADGQKLPYSDNSFDLVLQYTALSSLLDNNVKRNVATEMKRVVKKPNGCLIWYDFWINPKNPHTRGIRPTEIRQLFAGAAFDFRRITLAPPIARRIVHYSWLLSHFLENLKVFNTHYLVFIHYP